MERISEEEVTRLGNSIGYFKVNLPSTKEDYESGSGEGVWAVVKDQETYNELKSNKDTGTFHVYIANDSVYYPHLTCGSRVLVKHGGKKRHIAVFSKLSGTQHAEKNILKWIDNEDRCPGCPY